MHARLPRILQLRQLLALGGQQWQQPAVAAECRLLEHLQQRGAAAAAASETRVVVRQPWWPLSEGRSSQQRHATSSAAAAANSAEDQADREHAAARAAGASAPGQPFAAPLSSEPEPQPAVSSSAANSEGGDAFAGASSAQGAAGATAGAGTASSSDAHQEQQQQQGSAGAGFDAGAAAEEAKRRAEQARRAAAGWLDRARGVLTAVGREVTEVILPKTETVSATRRRAEGLRRADRGASTAAEVMVVEQPETLFQRRWKQLRQRFGGSPMFQRLEALGASLGDNAALKRSRELREDLRDRWETSDSPLVHRIQDMSDNMFTETEMARAYREVQVRDPGFDMVTFLRRLRADVPVIVRAYLLGQTEVLAEHCAPQMVEQLTAIIRAQHSQGQFTDATLLDVSEVELADVKFLEDDPVIVVQFNCQQINCVRDKFGNVVDGSPEDLQRVYYYWAIQQDPAGFVGTDGKHYPPRWQLREMLVRGMHALIG